MRTTSSEIAGVLAVLTLALALPTFADDTPDLEAEVAKCTYCSLSTDEVDVWIRLVITYKNDLGQRLILCYANDVAGYELFRDPTDLGTNRPLRRVKSKVLERFDASKMDTSEPNPKVFEVIHPGAVAKRQVTVNLVVRRPNLRSLTGGDYYLQVRVQPWPANRRSGEALASAWKSRGKLLTTPFTLPVRVHIQEPQEVDSCFHVGRID